MMSTSKYPFPLDLNEDHHYHQPFSTQPSSSSSSSSLSCPSFFSSPQEQGGYCHDDPLQFQYQEEANKVLVPHGGSCDRASLTNENTDDYSGLKLSIWKKEDRNENQSESSTASAKWMSSKMRLMRKMMNPNSSVQKFEDPKQPSKSLEADPTSCNNSNENCNNTIRVCSDCNTTKTPLWRSGPSGPKSLCNACGIRQRKARRAMAAAAAEAANGTVLAADAPPTKNKVQQKEKRSSNECVPQFKKKKKRKHTSPSRGRKNLCFEDLTIILSKSSAFQRVFPQDEKDAAILLMALSYGLVHG